MAEALFKELLAERGVEGDWRVESAGTWALDGQRASAHAEQVMREQGLDISAHRSQVTSGELLRGFDLILVMVPGHKEALVTEFPGVAQRVFLLSEMAGMEQGIPDPIGGSLETYRTAASEMEGYLRTGFAEILARVRGGG